MLETSQSPPRNPQISCGDWMEKISELVFRPPANSDDFATPKSRFSPVRETAQNHQSLQNLPEKGEKQDN